MSRKHFIAIAAMLREFIAQGEDRETIARIASGIAAILATTNPRFNRERFIAAALDR